MGVVRAVRAVLIKSIFPKNDAFHHGLSHVIYGAGALWHVRHHANNPFGFGGTSALGSGPHCLTNSIQGYRFPCSKADKKHPFCGQFPIDMQ